MDYRPKRVVSLQPSATVILRDLGKLSSLVACTKYCLEVCPEIAGAESDCGGLVDSASRANLSAQARPGNCFGAVSGEGDCGDHEIRSTLPGTGAQIARRHLRRHCGRCRNHGCDEEGSRVIRQMQEEIEAVLSRTIHLPKLRVFCEEWGKPLIASQAWVAELVDVAGGKFVGSPGAQISLAEVAAVSPDVIIAAWCGAGDRVPLEKIICSRKWENTPAAKNARVYCIRDEYLNTPAPTLVFGLHALAAAIHPECFPQADGLRCISLSIE